MITHNPHAYEFSNDIITAEQRIADRLCVDFAFGNDAIERGAKLAALAVARRGDGKWAARYEREYAPPMVQDAMPEWERLCEPKPRPRRRRQHATDMPRKITGAARRIMDYSNTGHWE